MDYNEKLDAAIARLHDEGRYRTFIDIERRNGQFPHAVWTKPDGSQQDITVWCGNDYLGMGQNPVVIEAMEEALRATGAGSGGTRNISGTTVYHKQLEAELADLHGKEAALLFTSAYIANDATLSTLPKLFPGLIIYSDALNHASMIEGVRRNGGAKRIFRHNDVDHLRALMAADDPAAPKLIAFESIYSMDGDFGPIEAICDIADEFGALTYIDGEEGILLHRGYPIGQLAENSSFMEVSYLLLNGELPQQSELDDFTYTITRHTMLHDQLRQFYQGFRRDAHPMAIMCGVVGALSAFYHDSTDISDPEQRKIASHRLIAKMPTIAAMAYKYSVGQPVVYPRNDLDYSSNFLRMCFAVPAEDYVVDPILSRAMDRIFILHACLLYTSPSPRD